MSRKPLFSSILSSKGILTWGFVLHHFQFSHLRLLLLSYMSWNISVIRSTQSAGHACISNTHITHMILQLYLPRAAITGTATATGTRLHFDGGKWVLWDQSNSRRINFIHRSGLNSQISLITWVSWAFSSFQSCLSICSALCSRGPESHINTYRYLLKSHDIMMLSIEVFQILEKLWRIKDSKYKIKTELLAVCVCVYI